MATIMKDKQYICYTTDDNKTYKYDLTNFHWLGIKGSPIRSTPPRFKETLMCSNRSQSHLMLYLYDLVQWYGASRLIVLDASRRKALSVCERLDACNIPVERNSLSDYRYSFLFENWTKFIQFRKEKLEANPNVSFSLDALVSSLLDKIEEEKKLKRRAIFKESTQGMTERQAKIFNDWLDAFETQYTSHEHCVCAYYIKQPWFNLMYTHISWRSAKELLITMLDFTHKLNVPAEKNQDFFRYLMELEKTYNAQKEAYDLKAFTSHYEKYAKALTFEWEEYTVVLPTKPQDIITEGQRQRNCVGGYTERVINGREHIVFIRKKNDVDKNYITCEIYDNGKIGQFYRACNGSPDHRDIKFQYAYAQHLSALWEELKNS
jgi:hypothetical protein